MICLLQCSYARYDHNWTMYENSYAPAHLPNGGGFSVIKFTLQNLFDMHEYVRNYWSQTNTNLPLVRYTGCKIKLYQSNNLDYIVKTQTAFPMTSGPLTYPSTQPSIMLQTKHSHIIPSKQTEKRKRPFKTIRLKPPSQLRNQWYFQKELANTPLCILYTSATSLDNFYTNPRAINSTITIKTLNTKLIRNRQWNKNPANGYIAKTEGTLSTYLYASRTNNPDNPKYGEIIALADTTKFTEGKCFNDTHRKDYSTWKTNTKQDWGNPFYPSFTSNDGTYTLYQSTVDPKTLFNSSNSATENATHLTRLLDGIILETRYNINRDNGQDNIIYFRSNQNAEEGWAPPTEETKKLVGLPLWLGLWGFVDFQKKLGTTIGIDTQQVLTIQTRHTQPIREILVPIDNAFTEGKSPYEEDANPWDRDKWYPQTQYQEETLTNIVNVGPGCPKMSDKLGEVHALYEFYFKFGGNPAPMATIENPEHQLQYPLPGTFIQTSSLQNPTQPIEYYLQNFDERRETLTRTATERISTDWETKRPFIDYAGLTMDPEGYQEFQPLKTQTTTEEESEEALLHQLLQQRQQQQLIKQRILQLMDKYQKLE